MSSKRQPSKVNCTQKAFQNNGTTNWPIYKPGTCKIKYSPPRELSNHPGTPTTLYQISELEIRLQKNLRTVQGRFAIRRRKENICSGALRSDFKWTDKRNWMQKWPERPFPWPEMEESHQRTNQDIAQLAKTTSEVLKTHIRKVRE